LGARDRSTGSQWGDYTADDAARRRSAGVEHETTDPEQAYARFGPPRERGTATAGFPADTLWEHEEACSVTRRSASMDLPNAV
jgi:hypothetical protein